jgi:two-component system sensor kinase
MKERMHRGARDLWWPILIVVIGWVLAGGGWYVLVQANQRELLDGARKASKDATVAIKEDLEQQRRALEGIADLWARFGREPIREWRADASLWLETGSGLSALSWIDLDESKPRRAVGGAASTAVYIRDKAAAQATYPNPQVLGPERDEAEGASYRVFLPVRSPDEHNGMLVAHVRLEELLGPLFQAQAPGYAIDIYWNGERVFRRGEATQLSRYAWWRADSFVALPFRDTSKEGSASAWRIVHRPTDALVAERMTNAPHLLLGAGLLLSVLVGRMVHQWRVVSRQARFLEVANRALEEKGKGLLELNLELERRVADRTERLQDVVAELEAFNYSVSHDLRSPLGAVLNLAAILEEEYAGRPLDAQGSELLERIQQAATRATALLEDLLQLSRAGQAVLTMARTDTTELARETFAQACAAEADSDVEFVLEPLPEVYADRTLLGAVFTNLFANALKYSRGCEKRRVRVSGRIEGDECQFEVTDNGRGFDMRFESKLFGLFERLHGDDEIGGTGVGLAMVARIVKRHGGRVWARGELGKGACFGFSLPQIEGEEG